MESRAATANFEKLRHILIIEPDAAERQILAKILEDYSGYDYRFAKGLQDAKEQLSHKDWAVDLAILSVSLSDVTNVEIFPLLKDIPFVVVAEVGSRASAEVAYQGGACHYVVKDLDHTYLKLVLSIAESIVKRNEIIFSKDLLRRDTEYLINQILTMAPTAPQGILKVLQAFGENYSWDVGIYFRADPVLGKLFCDKIWVEDAMVRPIFLDAHLDIAIVPGVELPGEVWQTKKPRWIVELANEFNSLRAPAAVKCGFQSALAFPITVGSLTLGVFEFFSMKTNAFDRDLLQTLDAIGSQTGIFIERKEVDVRLNQAYKDMEARVAERTAELTTANLKLKEDLIDRKRMEKEILQIPLQEQKRFGSQLHDGLCQELSSILLFVKSLTQKMQKESALDISELKKVGALLLNANNAARDTARGLYPGDLQSASLIPLLQELVARTQKQSGLNCAFVYSKVIDIDDDIATHLYRIAQEGIINAVQHGHATNIEISLIQTGSMVNFIMKDDGIGIAHYPSQTDGIKGIGLNIMKYRSHMMDAEFAVEKNLPNGVIIRFCFKNKKRQI